MTMCLTCGGVGARMDGSICGSCSGRGEIYHTPSEQYYMSKTEYADRAQIMPVASKVTETHVHCPACHGIAPDLTRCDTCLGTGTVRRSYETYASPDTAYGYTSPHSPPGTRPWEFSDDIDTSSFSVEMREPCPVCLGRTSTRLGVEEKPCSVCKATGMVSMDEADLIRKTIEIMQEAIKRTPEAAPVRPKKKAAPRKKTSPKKKVAPRKKAPAKQKTMKELMKERASEKKW